MCDHGRRLGSSFLFEHLQQIGVVDVVGKHVKRALLRALRGALRGAPD
jgi:hypothetical protein